MIVYTESVGNNCIVLGYFDTGEIIKKLSFSKNQLRYISDLCIWNENSEVNETKKINLIIACEDKYKKSHLKVVDFDGLELNIRESKQIAISDVWNIAKTIMKTNQETLFSSKIKKKQSNYKEILLIFGFKSSINMCG